MDLQLAGKRALVTGSSGGLGEAIAKTLAAEGVYVIVHGRNHAAARRVAEDIHQAGGKEYVVLGDLAHGNDAARIAAEAQSAFGGIDILVNNAGSFPERGWWDTSPEQWLELFNENVGSMVRLIQALVPGMKERGWGRVINLSSSAGVQPATLHPDYAATKSVAITLSVSLAKELAKTGVTVNAISPGPILTPGVQQLWRAFGRKRDWGEDWEEIERRAVAEVLPNPVGRFGRPEEIGFAVAMLCSPRAGYIHGANIRVDGGYVVGVN